MQLELLLLLHGDPDVFWSAASASRELRAPEAWVADRLVDMGAIGLLRIEESPEPTFAFDRSSPMAGAVDEIAATYAQGRTSIVRLIHNPGIADVEDFSDAFRLKGED